MYKQKKKNIIMSIFKDYKNRHSHASKEFTLLEYLDMCKKSTKWYSLPAERILEAIGQEETIDTKDDPRLSRIFFNKIIKRYPAFKEFYGMEDTIEQIVGFFRHAAQGLEEKKQVLYLLGPVGGGKSSLAEKIKSLMEKCPIYVVKVGDEVSPVFESPFGIFSSDEDSKMLFEEYGISKRYIPSCMSPWLTKRLGDIDYDLSKIKVIEMYPSIQHQVSIAKVEPGDENNSDISSLVGKVDIRKLAHYSQDDPDCYSYSGGLCRANQGILEFVEMFKAPIKTLHPLLTATQEGNFKGTEGLPAIPYQGIILAHSNESEWELFVRDKKNEAFLDRINVVRVPYCLRVDEEVKIYEKILKHSSLSQASCAPKTLDLLAKFIIMTRLVEPENSNIFSKLRVYNGENLKDKDPKAKSLQEYKDYAGLNEGMNGLSTRFAYKVLSKVFNYDHHEISANPIHLFYVLEKEVLKLQLAKETEGKYLDYLKTHIIADYVQYIGNEIQRAYVESYSDYGQNLFERYVAYADNWIQDNDYRDPETNAMMDRETLNAELEKMEKPAGIVNPKDFRHETVNFTYRYRANNSGKSPRWDAFEKVRNVIEKRIFTNTEDLLPVISFSPKNSTDDKKKHESFISRMEELGYTKRQIQLIVEWYVRVYKNDF
jgi:serine protein kinase